MIRKIMAVQMRQGTDSKHGSKNIVVICQKWPLVPLYYPPGDSRGRLGDLLPEPVHHLGKLHPRDRLVLRAEGGGGQLGHSHRLPLHCLSSPGDKGTNKRTTVGQIWPYMTRYCHRHVEYVNQYLPIYQNLPNHETACPSSRLQCS